MFTVSVLSVLSNNSLGKVSLEELSLLIKSASKLSSSLCEGSVESFVINFDSSVKLSLSIDFGLSKVVSKFLAECIEVISLSLAECFELLILDIKGLGECTSGLTDGFGDSSRFGLKELDEVELVVGVVDEVDLLEFSGLCSIESSLLLSKGIFESSALVVDGLNKGVVVVLKSISESGSISLERIVEGSSLSIEGVSEGLSCVAEGSVLSSLHITNNNFHVGESLIDASFKCISFGKDSSLNSSGSLLINSV